MGVFFDGSETHERRGQGASVETAVVTAGRRELAGRRRPRADSGPPLYLALVQENRVPAVPAMAAKRFLVPTAN